MARCDEYTILYEDVISEGSFGIVYQANKTKASETFMAKTFKSDDTKAKQCIVEQEMKVYGRMKSHPNILQFKEHITKKKVSFLILEFCQYEDMGKFYLNKQKKPDLSETIEILSQCAEALCFLHESRDKIIHNDIKPSNIYLTRTERNELTVKLAGFGLSTLGEQTVQGLKNCGNQLYKAPEYFEHEKVLIKCSFDIFALGLVLKAMLSFRVGETGKLSPGTEQSKHGGEIPIGEKKFEDKYYLKEESAKDDKCPNCEDLAISMTKYHDRPSAGKVKIFLSEIKNKYCGNGEAQRSKEEEESEQDALNKDEKIAKLEKRIDELEQTIAELKRQLDKKELLAEIDQNRIEELTKQLSKGRDKKAELEQSVYILKRQLVKKEKDFENISSQQKTTHTTLFEQKSHIAKLEKAMSTQQSQIDDLQANFKFIMERGITQNAGRSFDVNPPVKSSIRTSYPILPPVSTSEQSPRNELNNKRDVKKHGERRLGELTQQKGGIPAISIVEPKQRTKKK